MWLKHSEAIDMINNIARQDSPLQVIKQELIDVLSMTDKDSYWQVLDGVISSYNQATWFVEKRNLGFASPLVHSFIEWGNDTSYDNWENKRKDQRKHHKENQGNQDKNAGIVTLVREKDSTWNYSVYRYQIKSWWYPKDVIRQYKLQIRWNTDWIKITDSKWKEYPQDTKFTKWTNVYIKVPKHKPLNLDYLSGLDENTKEKIAIQENYIDRQKENRKDTLEKFNKQHPMWEDVEISFWIPVKEYEDIEKTLASITTNQTLDPKKYEVVVLLNRPNDKEEFDKATEEKILKFILNHPEYNIHLFKHTFNFSGSANMWEVYKLLWDTIIHRNTQRKNIKWMDMKKIRNLIVKRWAADSTEKHPDYLKHQLETYADDHGWKELVRLTWESRIPKDLALAYPLIEIDEFFQRYYDLEYAHGDYLKRDVWLWSYKARCYCSVWGTPPVDVREDTIFVRNVRNYVKSHTKNVCMHYDSDFIWATDGSTDRWIYSIIKWVPYCVRYNAARFDSKDKTKKIEWNNWAIKNKWKTETQRLELTTKNLERDLSAFYKQRYSMVSDYPRRSEKYIKYLSSHRGVSNIEKQRRLLDNVINPIMVTVLSKPDFMWLDSWDYELITKIDKKGNIVPSIKFNESAITKIKQVQQQRIADWYYDYRK